MPRVKSRAADRLVLRDVDWPTHTRLLHAFAERPGTRLTYPFKCMWKLS
jgi:hypothetical protein